MHIGTWECKSGQVLGKSGVILQTAEAHYQENERCIGIHGNALGYIENADAMNASQRSMHESYNLLALGLEPPEVLLTMKHQKEIMIGHPEFMLQRLCEEVATSDKLANEDKETFVKVLNEKYGQNLMEPVTTETLSYSNAVQFNQKGYSELTRGELFDELHEKMGEKFPLTPHEETIYRGMDRNEKNSAHKKMEHYLKKHPEKKSETTILDFIKLPKESIKTIVTEAQMRERETTNRTRSVMDVSWSPPKSFSIIHALTKDDALKAKMEQALTESVQETIAEWEKLAARRVRGWDKTEGGNIKKDEYGKKVQSDDDKTTGNIVYSAFMHYESRPVALASEPYMLQRLKNALGEDNVREENGHVIIKDADGSEKPFVRDPQLHLHTPIANLTYDAEDKKWYALQKGEMMKQLPYFQAAASQKLAARLEDMGFAIERSGSRWEIDTLATGNGRATIDRFSKPTANVLQYASDYNLTSAEDRKNLNLLIRNNKADGVKDIDILQKIWRAQLSEDELKTIEASVHNRAVNAENQGTAGYDFKKELEHHKISAEDCIDHVIAVESMRSAVFNTQDILAKAIHYGVTKAPEDIKAAFEKKLQSGEVHLANIKQDKSPPEYFTTSQFLKEERSLVNAVIHANGQTPVTIAQLYAKASGRNTYEASKFPNGDYTESQKSALESVLNAPGRVSFIEGDAGTGKTTVGLQIKRAAEMAGLRLISATVATKAKEVLEEDGYGKIMLVDKNNNIVMERNEETGKMKPKLAGQKEATEYYMDEYDGKIPPAIANTLKRGVTEQPQTLSKLMLSYQNYKKKLGGTAEAQKDAALFQRKMKGQVLFIDEAGQLGTEQALQVMEMVEKMDMRLILVGDRKQHRSVTRGNVLDVLVDHAGIQPFAITDIRRQSGELKIVCQHMAKGEYDSAFALLNQIGGVTQVKPDDAIDKKGKKKHKTKAQMTEDLTTLKKQFVDEIVERMQRGEDPTIVIPDHKTGQEIDEMLRERLQTLKASGAECAVDKDKTQKFNLLVRDNDFDSPTARTIASNYKVGMTLQFLQNRATSNSSASNGCIQRGAVAEVVKKKGDSITLKCKNKNGEEYTATMTIPKTEDEAKCFVVNKTAQMELCPGDRIQITKNIMVGNKGQMVGKMQGNDKLKGKPPSNGQSFTVKDIEEKNGEHIIVLDSGNGCELRLHPETDPTHANFQRQFYRTSYGAQGGTSDKGACMVFHIAKPHSGGKNGNLYVDLTRAAGDGAIGMDGKNKHLRVYTDNLQGLIEEARIINERPNSALSFTQLSKETPAPNAENNAASLLYKYLQDWTHLKHHPDELENKIHTFGLSTLTQLKITVAAELARAPLSAPTATSSDETEMKEKPQEASGKKTRAHPSAHRLHLEILERIVDKCLQIKKENGEMVGQNHYLSDLETLSALDADISMHHG